MTGLLLRNAELAGGRVGDVRAEDGRIAELGEALRARGGEVELDARGGAVLPGLHDHHVHLLAMAAAATSVPCGPPEVTDRAALARALRAADAGSQGWVRGVGYHESVAGLLDRADLDAMVSDRPVRVQHRGGALWVLNSRALAEAGLLDGAPGEPALERDAAGRATGRVWRGEALLRERIPRSPPALAPVGRRLAALGITGVTDATPELSAAAVALLASGELPQRRHLLGMPLGGAVPPEVTAGPWKLLPPDHEPPDWQWLHEGVTAARAAGRPVAIHAVTRESLVASLAVLADVGPVAGDRIEHAAVTGDDVLPLLAAVGPVVVTQPAFVAERGDDYARDVPAAEHADLYRYAGLLAAGVRVAPSSDAPFASPDPWRAIAAATRRRTPSGAVLGPAERVPAERVLAGFLAPLADPGGPPREVAPGAPADLCVLRVPLADALREPDASLVRATIRAGEVVHGG